MYFQEQTEEPRRTDSDQMRLCFFQDIQTYCFPTEIAKLLDQVLSTRGFRIGSRAEGRVTWDNASAGSRFHFDHYTCANSLIWEKCLRTQDLESTVRVLEDEYEDFMMIVENLVHKSCYPFVAATPELRFEISGQDIQESKGALVAKVAHLHSRKNCRTVVCIDLLEATTESVSYLLTPANMEI